MPRHALTLLVLTLIASALASACAPAHAVERRNIYTVAPAAATLVVQNRSREPIYRVQLSPSASSSWGADQLGADVLQVGQQLTLRGIAPGHWDLRVIDRSGHVKEWRLEAFHAGGTYTADIGPSGWASL